MSFYFVSNQFANNLVAVAWEGEEANWTAYQTTVSRVLSENDSLFGFTQADAAIIARRRQMFVSN